MIPGNPEEGRTMIRWLVAVLLLPLAAGAAEVAGVKVPETVTVAGQELRLNGAAVCFAGR
jgi:hypothetical protein